MKFGAHESIEGGVFNAVLRGQTATCDTIQMFNKSNNQWRAKKLTTEEVDKFFSTIEETGIDVACSHSSYLINLASADPALNEKSYSSFKEEVERCNLLKIANLVIHPGSHLGTGEQVGMDRIATNLNRVFGEVKGNTVTVCLETTAGQGSNLGYTFEQIAYMMDKVEDKAHIGVCMDTCHIFAAGYPIIDPKEYKKTMKSFEDIVGLEKLKVIHMNDSKRELGSRIDRHEHIGKGQIGLEGFRNFVNDRKLAKIPMVIETPKEDDLKEDIENLKILRSLVKAQ
ncbi:MAG TPA: deoxyribonuclease IV [Candidatus Acidoferrum sp.]|nr:deoxyribonuclease IV [Candidatus Acidoferrum sp.]